MAENNENRFTRLLHTVIDFEMLPAKFSLFFQLGYYGAIVPFMNNFYVSLGLTATHAGLISGISLLVSSPFNPLWSSLADITGYRKLIYLILCIGSASTVFSMPWIERAVAITNKTMICTNITAYETNDTCTEKFSVTNISTLFKAMLILNAIGWTFMTSLRCYVEGTVTNVANTRKTKKDYGPQRAMGCVGYAFFNIISGFIAQHYHPENMSHYTAIFYVYLPCVICLIPVGCVLINQTNYNQSNQGTGMKKSEIFRKLLSLFCNVEFVIFLLTVVVYGFSVNVYNCFFFLFMEKDLKSPKYLMSIALGIGVFTETIMFVFATKFIKLFKGTMPSLIIGLFSYAPRFVIMSYFKNPWCVLATQCLHSLGLGLAWTSIVEHTAKIVPADIRITAVAMVTSIVFIGTSAITNMVGGIMFDSYGGRLLFRYTGIFAAAWCLFVVLYYGVRKMVKRAKTEPVSDDIRGKPSYPQGISQDIDL